MARVWILRSVVVQVLFATISLAAPAADEITSLPGWDGALPVKMYSGFVDAGPCPRKDTECKMNMHYMFMASEGDPSTDPVIIWYNGGPGASSLFGLLVELGPLLLNDDSYATEAYRATAVPTLLRNPYSWTKFASVLAFDNPPPVGFSYCEAEGAGPGGGFSSCGAWDDGLVEAANHAAITAVFASKFPELASNPLFLVGESYAGIYVPTIVRSLLAAPGPVANLRGFAVGDGCIGTEVLCMTATTDLPEVRLYYTINFLWGHGAISNSLYNLIMAECTAEELHTGIQTPACLAATDQVAVESPAGGYYEYGVYDNCYWRPEQPFAQSPLPTARSRRSLESISIRAMETSHESLRGVSLGHVGPIDAWDPSHTNSDGYPCAGSALYSWLNLTSVRSALHVAADSIFLDSDGGSDFNYTLTEKNVLPIYLAAVEHPNLRVLVYNGDTDPSVPSIVTQDRYTALFEEVGVQQTKRWGPWTLDGKRHVGGYSMDYQGNFTFLTIRGSGHMVPEFKPQAAQSMMSSFIQGEPFRPYRGPSQRSKPRAFV